MKTEDELRSTCEALLSNALAPSPVVMSLDEFRRLYNILLRLNERYVPSVIVVNLGDQAHLMFPELSRQEIVVEKKPIAKDDFEFLSMVDWRGPDAPAPGFGTFLVQEIRSKKVRTSLIAFIVFAAFVAIGPSKDTFDLVNTLLIQAGTVFLSIYLIFTVAQSERLSYDRKLFDAGILHQYYADDRNITRFAILTVAME